MVSMSPMIALVLCALATACGGSADDDPAASGPAASESETPDAETPDSGTPASGTPDSETPAPETEKCTTEFYSECIEVWVDGRAVPVGKDSTSVQFGHEDAPTVYALDFPPVARKGDRLKLPSGYEPQTNRSGTSLYFDYVLTRPLEAGVERQPYRVYGMDYSRTWVNSPRFTPLTSEAEIRAAVGTGKIVRVDDDRTPYWGPSDIVHLFSPKS